MLDESDCNEDIVIPVPDARKQEVMNTYKLTIEYDGTDFSGWQIQPGMRTVQLSVEEALERILGRFIRITAAGRTDSGVHATGQVANFSAETGMSPERLTRAMNGVLPRDVTVVRAEAVASGFNARFDATSRTYRYTMTSRRISVGHRYAWHVKYPLSTGLLEEATRSLEGEIDLRGFSKEGENDDFRTIIHKNSWTFRDNCMIFEIGAIRFFHHAVRSIVGTAVEVARGREKPDHISRILETRDRSLAGPTAPASGLCLVEVKYGDVQ